MPQKQFYTSEDYWNLPEGQRAELIDGKLYAMAPPSPFHQELVMEISAVIHSHIKSKDGNCKVYPSPFAVNLNADDKIWVEPDISIICDTSRIDSQGCKGAPDWIVNPMKKAVQTYVFEGEEDSNLFSFDEEIPVRIFDGLAIQISDLV